ncbi:MAG: plastocyanin/azurin family copper-binding protein [Thaumarchaeota archaeon]|nr:plastocyanin/azurin family copper-binding protein [Nitrososphaerota archaeon]
MDTSYPKITPSTKRVLYLIGIIAILIPILLTYVLLYPPMFPTNVSTSQSSTQSSAQGVTITIPQGIGGDRALNFQSANVTVAPGTTITFVNDDSSIHDIDFTSMPPGATVANNPSPNTNTWSGNSFTYTFTTPGTYSYKCDYHSWMTGTITVT